MTSPVSSLRSERTGARTGEGMDPPSFEEAERLLWRYLEEGTDIMFKHVSGKISRRLDRMSKSLDYLESSTTILVQRAKKKEIPTWGAELPAHAENLAAWSSETRSANGNLLVICRDADSKATTRVVVQESDSWKTVRENIGKSVASSSRRALGSIYFEDLMRSLIYLDSESSWALCKSLQALKDEPHISLLIKDNNGRSSVKQNLKTSKPADSPSSHAASYDFFQAESFRAPMIRDEIRNNPSSLSSPSTSDSGKARLFKLKPPPLKIKTARASTPERSHGELFVSSSILSLRNMKIANLKEYDVELPASGSCFKNIMYKSKLEDDESYHIALLEQQASRGPVIVDLKPSYAVLRAGESCKIALRFSRNAEAGINAAKGNLPNILVGIKAQHSDYFDVLKLRFATA